MQVYVAAIEIAENLALLQTEIRIGWNVDCSSGKMFAFVEKDLYTDLLEAHSLNLR